MYSQWLPGALNDILITFTNTSFSNLLRLNFRIVPIPKEIGSSLYECHYVYLAGVPVLTIMIIGRWKSDAFLRYIRKQVALFSQNLTDKMLQVSSFFTMPDFHRADSSRNQMESPPANLDTENGPSRSWGIFRHEPTAQN